MTVLTRKIFCYRLIYLYHCRHFHYDQDSIVIASAVRSPWVQRLGRQYPTVTSTYMISTVLEAAAKQSGAPLEKLQKVYMAEKPVDDAEASNKLRYGELMKKAKHVSVAQGDNVAMNPLLMAIEDLKRKQSEIVIVGGVKLASELHHKEDYQCRGESGAVNSDMLKDYISRCEELHVEACKEGVFDAELISLRFIKQDGNKRLQVEITQDALLDGSGQVVDGAAALVLTTSANAGKYNIKPLVAIKDIVLIDNVNKNDEKATLDAVQSLVNKAGISISAIRHWEFNIDHHLVFDLQKHFHIPWEDINPYGCISTFPRTGCEHQMGILSHIAHTLKPNELGYVVLRNDGSYVAILLNKLPAQSPPNCLPRLTLFTKDPCHLCDILVEELEANFAGEYDLKKLYIDTKENVRYLRLYRHDIPVLHLNGQFLCMHRLNARLLRRKLDALKESKSM